MLAHITVHCWMILLYGVFRHTLLVCRVLLSWYKKIDCSMVSGMQGHNAMVHPVLLLYGTYMVILLLWYGMQACIVVRCGVILLYDRQGLLAVRVMLLC